MTTEYAAREAVAGRETLSFEEVEVRTYYAASYEAYGEVGDWVSWRVTVMPIRDQDYYL